ncbi:FecR domain-containing protein [filamentous cyanobacterium LEGE 11480]|uniref:FecR domain-containing protein n=1 Tax=Romeriopsis navalis LEGE 11480 TaxID=2777977 RepID=A0A928VL88_9CYAN|nr:FecR domain-containing protein [Romeriopsis navalis]MBE9029798.1 FecR domain-containing protein [Romeriopsis navalis LEGE 11480]
MVTRHIYTIGICVASLVLTTAPVLARTPLYYAHITAVRNRVSMLSRYQRTRIAKVSDLLMWGDGIATSRSSRADLRFNDGSRVRFGQHVVFRFEPGTRRINLSNGTVLLLIPPKQGRTRVYTPNAVAGIQGSALFVRYDAGKNQTIVGALTDSGIQVSRPDGTQTQTLAAGQIIVVAGDQVQPAAEFDLKSFYKTSPIVQGFQLDQADAPNTDAAMAQVRAETLAGLTAQRSFTPAEQRTTLSADRVRLSSLNNAGLFDQQQQIFNAQAIQSHHLSNIVTGAETPHVIATPTNPAVINIVQPPTGLSNVPQPATPLTTVGIVGNGVTTTNPTPVTNATPVSDLVRPANPAAEANLPTEIVNQSPTVEQLMPLNLVNDQIQQPNLPGRDGIINRAEIINQPSLAPLNPASSVMPNIVEVTNQMPPVRPDRVNNPIQIPNPVGIDPTNSSAVGNSIPVNPQTPSRAFPNSADAVRPPSNLSGAANLANPGNINSAATVNQNLTVNQNPVAAPNPVNPGGQSLQNRLNQTVPNLNQRNLNGLVNRPIPSIDATPIVVQNPVPAAPNVPVLPTPVVPDSPLQNDVAETIESVVTP